MHVRQPVLICAAAAIFFADANGIPPRKSNADYPAHQTSGDLTIGAAILTPAEIRNVFTADLDHAGYLVFEVAAYPANGAQVDLGPGQFTLRANPTGSIAATVAPDAIVEQMFHGKTPAPQVPGKVNVSTTTEIGYESGSPGRRGGIYTGQSVNVGVGQPPPQPAPTGGSKPKVDRDQLLAELTAREFPETKAAAPVAGYLYFPKPDRKPKSGAYELTYTPADRSGDQIVLQVKN
jgi:hypothetical protein